MTHGSSSRLPVQPVRFGLMDARLPPGAPPQTQVRRFRQGVAVRRIWNVSDKELIQSQFSRFDSCFLSIFLNICRVFLLLFFCIPEPESTTGYDLFTSEGTLQHNSLKWCTKTQLSSNKVQSFKILLKVFEMFFSKTYKKTEKNIAI